jgi:hypothetical protein
MYIKIDLYEFRNAFHRMGRGEQFSYQGLEVLFDYLEELEHCEEPYELDVIALCCDFAESTARDIAEAYSIDLSESEGLDDDEVEGAIKSIVIEYLEDEGAFVGDTLEFIIYRQF